MSVPQDHERRASAPPALSPCIRVCRIDQACALCTGCLRTLAEITAWPGLDDEARRRILQQLPTRQLLR